MQSPPSPQASARSASPATESTRRQRRAGGNWPPARPPRLLGAVSRPDGQATRSATSTARPRPTRIKPAATRANRVAPRRFAGCSPHARAAFPVDLRRLDGGRTTGRSPTAHPLDGAPVQQHPEPLGHLPAIPRPPDPCSGADKVDDLRYQLDRPRRPRAVDQPRHPDWSNADEIERRPRITMCVQQLRYGRTLDDAPATSRTSPAPCRRTERNPTPRNGANTASVGCRPAGQHRSVSCRSPARPPRRGSPRQLRRLFTPRVCECPS